MTRNGKIARLPNDLRDQLNCRIRDGEPGKSLLRWLNGLPEVKALLKAEFANHPIAPSNLSEWKNGGYLDWLARQDALALVNDLQEQSAPGSPNFDQALNDKLARWASIQYAATARNLIAAETDPLLKWSRLCQLCGAIARLRRIELFAERISIERQWLAIEQAGADKQREKDFWAWTQRPDVQKKLYKKGMSIDSLKLLDRYLMEGISPLDPDEAEGSDYLGQWATKPPSPPFLDPPESPSCATPPDATSDAASPSSPDAPPAQARTIWPPRNHPTAG